MQESGEKYLNDMVGRAMNDDSRPAGNPHANPGPADSGHGNSGRYNAGPVNSGYDNTGTVDSDYIKSGQVKPGPVNSGYDNSGSIDSGYIKSGHVRPGPVNSGHINPVQTQGQASGQKTGHGNQAKASPGKGKGGFFKGLISGTVISDSIILKDVRYSAMIFLLAVIFIANRFNAERVERDIAALEQEVRDLRAESLSVSADLGSVSRQSEISDLVKERGLGLEELREPPYRIVVNE